MGMKTFNMFGTFSIQIPDYFETHYKEDDEELSEYFIARHLPEDPDWENYGDSEQGISVTVPRKTEYEGVDFTDKELQETILSKLKAIMDESKESMLAGTSGIMRAIMIKALETDCPYIYHAEKNFIVIIYTESQSCSTRSAFAFFNNCALCQITFRDNRNVDTDEKKHFSSSVLDSIAMEISASESTGNNSANIQKKTTSKTRKKPKVCPIPQDFKDYTTINDKDFKPDSVLAQSVVCYLLSALSKIDLHFSSQKSDHEIGNDLFKDLVNVASFQKYQESAMEVIGNDHYIKPLILYTIRDFFSSIRHNGKADRDRIISSYSGLFIDIMRFFYTNDRISDPELLVRGMGTLGLRYRNVILDDVTAFSKKLKQTPEKRLLAGREWVTKICSQPDLHFLCSKDKINHLMLFKYLCDDVLHFQENDFEWDETQGKHKINGIQANGEVIWNHPELFFMWNDMPKLVVEYLRAKEDSNIGISENDKNRKCPWDVIGEWTPFSLFFAATQDKVTMSFSEDGHVYLCLTELLSPFESSLKKILSEKIYSISPKITIVSSRSEVTAHNFQWGMEVQDIGFCSGQKLYAETMTVLKEYKKEYKREIAYAWPSQKFSHSPSIGFFGMGGFMGSGGVSFKSFSSVDFDRDEDELYDQPSEQVKEKIDSLFENTSEFSEEQRALHYARLFRVSETAFDKWSDRENEIRNGYLKDSRMLTTFREFVWSLASYLADQGKTFDAVTNEDIHNILDMIEIRENTNYAEDSYFPELCSVSDNFSIYTDMNDPDIRIAKAFTALSESENDTVNCSGNLSALRNEIRLLIPAMDLIYDDLKASRDSEKPLEGKPADILNAWCIIALAAKENVVSATTGRLGFVWDRFTDDDDFQDPLTPSEIISGIAVPWMVHNQTDKTIIKINENIREKDILSSTIDESFVIVDSELVKYLGTDKIVTIPEGVKNIKPKAFDKNKTMEEVILPDSLQSIEKMAFYYRTRLKKVHFSGNLKSIGEKAFARCSNLEEAILPDSLENLGVSAFEECDNILKVHISENLEKINEKTFYHCRKIEEIRIPDNIRLIGIDAFRYCSKLKRIDFGKKLETIDRDAFVACYSLEEFDLPEGIQKIGSECFNGISIKTLKIPSSVSEISKGAFRTCTKLVSVTFEGSLQKIDEDVFRSCSNLNEIKFPDNLKEIGEKAFAETGFEAITLPGDLESIGKSAFANCAKLKGINFTGPVSTISERAFDSCKALTEIELPEGIQLVDQYAFTKSGVETVIFPEKMGTIGPSSFSYCDKLRNILFKGTVRNILDNAFSFCENIGEVYLPDGIKEISKGSFQSSGIEMVSFPKDLETIGEYAFSSCKKLKKIFFRGSAKEISEIAFTTCNVLSKVVFPEGLLSIKNHAFYSYGSETESMCDLSLYIPSSISEIGEDLVAKDRKVTIYCHKSSYAENYAHHHNYRVITDPRLVSHFISSVSQSFQAENSSSVRQAGNNSTTIFIKKIENEINDEQIIRAIAADACKNGRDLAWLYFILRNEWTLGVLNCSDIEFLDKNQKYFPEIPAETLLMRRQQAMPWLNDSNTFNSQLQMLYSTDFEQRYTMLVSHFLDRINPVDPWQHINNAFGWLRNFFSPQEQQILWNRLCERINAIKTNILNQLSAINFEFTSFETAKQYLGILLEDPSPEKYDRMNPYNYLVPDAYLSIGLFDQSRSGLFVSLISSHAWVWNTTLDEVYRAAVRNVQDQRTVKSDGKELIRRLLPQYLY